jgi:REP element-mobilizing transposase RayT
MSDNGYKIRNKKEIHFITFSVVEWVDVFTRRGYRDITVDSLKFCQKEKGLLLHGWCIMSNHMHLLASSANYDLSGILCDFKKFTSKKIIEAIINNDHESRKEWMIRIFSEAGKRNSRNTDYQFWRQDNQPKECYSSEFTIQKLNYIHNNPVETGLVEKAEDYLYSSARNYIYGNDSGLLGITKI